MVEFLTGSGLALAAGLNAYVPLLALGLLGRYGPVVDLPAGWEWLSDPLALGILGALFLIEVVADKVPSVDHLNDIVQTVVRPTSGGLVFAAGAGSVTPAVSDPSAFFTSSAALPVIVGAGLALVTHLLKAGTRPVVNLSTAGTGAPVISVVEDVASVTLAVLALLVPVLVLVFVAALAVLAVVLLRRGRPIGGRLPA